MSNIILIMTDQQRLDTMHYAAPDSLCVTPVLDALAEESLCFTNAYTVSPVCTPARAALHTGLYPSVTGMNTNIYQEGCQTHEIADRPFLLSRRLESQGYACGFTGKWHLGLGRDKTSSSEGMELLARREKGYMGADAYLHCGTLPSDIGFIGDDFPGHGNGGHNTPQFLQYLQDHGLERTMTGAYRGNRPGDHSKGAVITSGEKTSVEYFLSQRALKITDQLAATRHPFFLALNFWGPHEPYYALAEDYALYQNLSIPPWPSFTGSTAVESRLHMLVQRPEKNWSFFENNLRHYYAVIANIDRQIGRFLDGLRSRGLYDDSWIIFTADHGDSQGCHNGMENKSGHMYDDTTKIPLMIRPPHGLTCSITSCLASTVDLYATILDIAGLPSSTWQSGFSLLPLLSAPNTPIREDIVTECVSAFPVIATQRMYRRSNLKYVFNAGGRDELYHLSSDPHEMRNLIDTPAYAELLRDMREGLSYAMERNGDPTVPWFCKMNHIREWAL